VQLAALTELALDNCHGVDAAVAGCLAHSTGIKRLTLAFPRSTPPLALPAVAWPWPRLSAAVLRCPGLGPGCMPSAQGRALAAAGACAATSCGAGGEHAAEHVLSDLLDASLSPAIAADWLFSSGRGSGGGSSSGGSDGSSSQEMTPAAVRAAAASWTHPAALAQLAAGLPNLCKLELCLFTGRVSPTTRSVPGATLVLAAAAAVRLARAAPRTCLGPQTCSCCARRGACASCAFSCQRSWGLLQTLRAACGS
jgi:hypothetical protein